MERPPSLGDKQDEANALSPVDVVIADAARDLFSRLLDRYLPNQDKGYVGDDEPRDLVTDSAAPAPHQVLGLGPDAPAVAVKRRLRQLARVFHPDVEDGNADKMAEINAAARELLRRCEEREDGT